VFLSKPINAFIYRMLVSCSLVYVTKAMEQPSSVMEEKIEKQVIPVSSLAAMEKKTEEQVSPFESLPLDLKAYIISFLVNAEKKKEAIKNIKYLAATSKGFYTIINNPQILGSIIKGINERFGKPLIDVALEFKNPGATWLKEYIKKDMQTKDILDKSLLEAVQAGDSILTQFVLNAGADVNGKEKLGGGYTPLHWAVFQDDKNSAELLLGYGADVNKATKLGNTPLNTATSSGKKNIVELLLNAGAAINQTNNIGDTPLYRAAANGHKEIVELLLNAGADVNNPADKHGNTPLSIAVSRGYEDIVKLLRKFGASTLRDTTIQRRCIIS
jgi:hypothetical protein